MQRVEGINGNCGCVLHGATLILNYMIRFQTIHFPRPQWLLSVIVISCSFPLLDTKHEYVFISHGQNVPAAEQKVPNGFPLEPPVSKHAASRSTNRSRTPLASARQQDVPAGIESLFFSAVIPSLKVSSRWMNRSPSPCVFVRHHCTLQNTSMCWIQDAHVCQVYTCAHARCGIKCWHTCILAFPRRARYLQLRWTCLETDEVWPSCR